MPMPIHLKVKGQKQGEIQGSCTSKGRENTVMVQALAHTIEIPRSPQTGLPTGQRVHGAITATKEVDKSSPKLMQALCTGELLTEVEFDYYRINNKSGQEEKYYTILLKNAIVVAVKASIPNCLDAQFKSFGHMEDISFTYKDIRWTWAPDGIEAEDNYDARQ